MKIYIFTIFCLTYMGCFAQESSGIKFETGLNWKAILEKAKSENKFIFLDGYATWCGPCKKMTADVFTVKEVGNFFNENFINIAVQFDSSGIDNQQVKKWYKDAKMIAHDYNINAYPTYLFFSPTGDLVHKLVGTFDPQDFIAQSKSALSPQTQYVSLKKQFESGRKDTVFLLALINLAEKADDNDNLPVYYNHFLATQKNLLTPRNILFISKSIEHSADIGYTILKNNVAPVEAVIGNRERLSILQKISFDEDILPVIRIGGTKQKMGGGMVIYSGKLADSVDWEKVYSELHVKYDAPLAEQILLIGKLDYYTCTENWDSYNKTLVEYSKKDTLDIELIHKEAWNFATYCSNVKALNQAVEWAVVLDNDQYNNKFQQTYSRLLYKAGKKTKAIAAMKKYQSSMSTADPSIDEIIKKMENEESIP